jgi:hypothetical protein
MNMFKAFLTILMLFVCVTAQSTQRDSQFDAAAEAFESGEYEQTIALLAAYEKSRGTSPRLESLRALAYRDLEKPKEAHQAILVYLRLTANRDMSGSEAHQDMLALRDEMLEAIEKKYKEDKEELDKERDEEADAIVAELESVYSSPQIKRSYSSALPASLKSEADDQPGEYIGPSPSASKAAATGMDALAELEMWRKINQSTVAMDYFLFIETFPNGQFTEIARKKMLEVGDPAWNAVRNDHDPFKFRDFIKNNPDSPFIEVAKTRMNELAKVWIDWEQVRDSRDPSTLRAFEARHSGHALAAESKKIRAEIAWRNIENTTSQAAFTNFAAEFPESLYAAKAKAATERLQPKPATVSATGGPEPSVKPSSGSFVFSMGTAHNHGPLGKTVPTIGDLNFDGRSLAYIEKAQLGLSAPDPAHNFTMQCSDVKSITYKALTLTIRTRSGEERSMIPTADVKNGFETVEAQVDLLKKNCVSSDATPQRAQEASGQPNSGGGAGSLAKFSGVKFEAAKDAVIWSEFTLVAPCIVKVGVYSTVVTYPIKDDLLLDLRFVASARAKKGRWWQTQVEHAGGEFDIARSTYTRKPQWGQVKESFSFRLKSLSIAAFGDELTASELASEIERLAAECRKN